MTIDNELRQLEGVLEGLNYTVFLNVYTVGIGIDAQPEAIIQSCFPRALIGSMSASNLCSVLNKFDRDVQYRGDSSAGPEPGTFDSPEFKRLHKTIRMELQTTGRSAVDIHEFYLREGHPAYPVFWDYAFLFRFGDHSRIWIGSSSD